MTPPQYGHCRACPAKIRWARHARTGRPMPLNAEPDPIRGNVSLDGLDNAFVLGPEKAAARREAGDQLYLIHFATCPARERFRRSKS